jgi:hypothetical protein
MFNLCNNLKTQSTSIQQDQTDLKEMKDSVNDLISRLDESETGYRSRKVEHNAVFLETEHSGEVKIRSNGALVVEDSTEDLTDFPIHVVIHEDTTSACVTNDVQSSVESTGEVAITESRDLQTAKELSNSCHRHSPLEITEVEVGAKEAVRATPYNPLNLPSQSSESFLEQLDKSTSDESTDADVISHIETIAAPFGSTPPVPHQSLVEKTTSAIESDTAITTTASISSIINTVPTDFTDTAICPDIDDLYTNLSHPLPTMNVTLPDLSNLKLDLPALTQHMHLDLSNLDHNKFKEISRDLLVLEQIRDKWKNSGMDVLFAESSMEKLSNAPLMKFM